MRLLPIHSFRPDSGHCWLADLPEFIVSGENVGHTRPSPLRLFEGSQEIGPPGSSHDDIRTRGSGAFSHWGRQLYFSASDNSNPNTNQRSYHVLAPTSEEEILNESRKDAALFAGNPDLLRAYLSASLSTQGTEFHTLFSLRTLLSVLKDVEFDLTAKRVLEIGASPSHGLGIALALLGSAKVFLNNVEPMAEEVSWAYAANVSTLTGLMGPLRRRLSEVVEPVGAANLARLNRTILEALPSMDAAALPPLVRGIDLVFSFSVLEHIRHLPTVLQRLRQAVVPNGLSIHWIDLRDHTDFNDPLKFLRLSEPEFLSRYSAEHNRWRRSEYVRMFKEVGWDIVRERFAGQLPTLSQGRTDMLAVAAEGPERTFVGDPKRLIPADANAYVDLSPEYRRLPPEELAVMVLELIARPA